MNLAEKKILLTGGGGFLGKFVHQKLLERGVPEANIFIPRSATDDLRQREVCDRAVAGRDIVIHLAAFAGGIQYNGAHPAEMIYNNATMALNLIDAAHRAGVEKFVAWGSVCAYPKIVPVPFKEDDIWNGYPEETNGPYGVAKRTMLTLVQSYRKQYGMNAVYLLPLNLYGPGDHFEPEKSHVVPALIKKFIEAIKQGEKEVEVWGSGKATREFLYVEDAAEAAILAAERYDKPEPVNIGPGKEVSIRELTETIARILGFKGRIKWDATKPDGQPRRSLDVSRAEKEFGFKAKTPLEDGLKKTIEWYKNSL